MTSKSKNDEPVSQKVKTKNNLRGDDPNDNTSIGRDLNEQSFSS